MSNYFLFLIMLCAGAMVAIQPSINARLAQKVGLLESACLSFMVGTIVLFLVSLMMGRGNWRGAVEARWWELTGGLFGAFFVTATIVAIPRIGTAATMAAVIAAQLSAGILLDHYGFFGFREVPFDLKRFMGMLLLLGGAWLVFRR